MRAAEEVGEKIAVDFTIDSYREVTHMVIYTPDHPGLFAKITGALALAGVAARQRGQLRPERHAVGERRCRQRHVQAQTVPRARVRPRQRRQPTEKAVPS
jgi:UTP:GlnB (protein PII) uridylyltransferase